MKGRNLTYKFYGKFFFIFCITFYPLICFSQVDTLNINFRRISINDTVSYRTLNADFPYPVLSLIEIKDKKNDLFFHGLADTARWLTPQDFIMRGDSLTVDDVWKNILEYHKYHPSFPDNPNVKDMIPQYLITEVSNVEGEGIAVALAMDYSGSMIHVMQTVEKCAKEYIRNMTRDDRTSIVKFAGEVEVFQEFTSDTTLLLDAIDRDYRYWRGTRLYDGIYKALQLTVEEEGRRAVIAYTDGRNLAQGGHTETDVINYAKENKIPVFTIGLGEESPTDVLTLIADETGGYYTYTSTGEDLTDIYLGIYGLIQGYYVLAHTSTDPIRNGTWRTVAVSVKYDSTVGQGQGDYQVPFTPVDIGITKKSVTDSILVSGTDTSNIAVTNHIVTYEITAYNNGPKMVGPISIKEEYPQSFIFLESDLEPDSVTQDSIIWTASSIDNQEKISWNCTFYVDTVFTNHLLPLVNTISIKCYPDSLDYTDYNNVSVDTVYYSPLIPPDLVIAKEATSDSLVLSQGDSLWYIFSADTFYYKVSIKNQGELPCQDIKIKDILPDYIKPITIPASFTVQGDTLKWTINKLESGGDKKEYAYTCYIDTLLIPNVLPVVNQVIATASSDTNISNNTARDTLYYIPLNAPDVKVIKRSRGDSLVISSGDSTWFSYPGDTILYKVTLVNQGQLDCHNITVTDVLSDKITLIDFPVTYTYANDSIIWQVDEIVSNGGSVVYAYTCKVDTFMPPWDEPLVNIVTISSVEDTIYHNNSAQDTVWAVGVVPPQPQVLATPSKIEPLDNIQVSVMTPIKIVSWDMIVLFGNGSTDDTYWDDFIESNELEPGTWSALSPIFEETEMLTTSKKEKVGFIIKTEDFWQVNYFDTAYVTIASNNEFYLDHNVFKPSEPGENVLFLHFKLSSNRKAELNIYDIAGHFVKNVFDDLGVAGWNFTTWDGTDERDEPVGSGIYLAIISSGSYNKYLKFILIR